MVIDWASFQFEIEIFEKEIFEIEIFEIEYLK